MTTLGIHPQIFKSMVWGMVALAVALALSGCGPKTNSLYITPLTYGMPPYGYGDTPATPPYPTGVAVIGQGLLWEKPFLTAGAGDCTVFSTHWMRLNAEPADAPNVSMSADKIGCVGNDAPPVRYNTLKLPPGRYVMQSYSLEVIRNHFRTSQLFQPTDKPTYEQAPGPKFTIAADEVVYLGDFYFAFLRPDADTIQPNGPQHPKLVAIKKNEAAAREAVAVFGIDPNKLVFRAPKG